MPRSLNPKRLAVTVGELLLLVSGACTARGQVVNPDNGHAYQFFPASSGPYTWADADRRARAQRFHDMPGHLATVTTELENNFLIANFPDGDGWLGGVQAPGNPSGSGWRWVTGEDWRYTHWREGEPNDDSGNTDEDRLQWYADGWNDNSDWHAMGFFVEFEPYQMPDVVRALRIASGIETASSDDLLRLAADNTATDQRIDLPDAMRIARQSAAPPTD